MANVNISPSANYIDGYTNPHQHRNIYDHVGVEEMNRNGLSPAHPTPDVNGTSNSGADVNGGRTRDHVGEEEDNDKTQDSQTDDYHETETETDNENDLGEDGEAEQDDDSIDGDDGEEEQPVKLFVGQVPKNMDEADLFPIFEHFGPMEDVAIIRDKHTGQHRGCAFVTFLTKESADQCEKELHNTFPFEGGKRPVQVRPAGKKEDSKVFVGMLPRNVTEEMVTSVFEHYGEISGVFVIRSTDGYRKGCAFVKFVNRADAYNAIAAVNGKVIFQEDNRPLIVKIADTRGEKKMRMNQNRRDGHHGHGSFSHDSVYSDTASDSPQMNGHNGNMYYMHSPPGHLNMPGGHHLYPSQIPGLLPGRGMPQMDVQSHAHGSYSSYPGHGHAHGDVSPIPGEYMYPPPPQQLPTYMPGAEHQHAHVHSYPRPPRQQNSNARPREGPAGANLFIYHLPHDLTDADLATAFNPFGNVISAKVYVDKYTGESKGFGFVSYDSIIAAEQAIELMNGFQIGNKRLKVQHKRVHHRQTHHMPNVNQGVPQYEYFHPHQVGPPPPASMMPSHGPGHNQLHHAPMPYHDVPVPSIEIKSKGDDNTSTLRSINSVNTAPLGQNDIDNLTQSFSGLHAEERNGNV